MTAYRTVTRSLGAAFLTGALVVVPFLVSISVMYLAANFVDSRFRPALEQFVGWHIPGLGIVAMVTVLLGVGYLAQSVLGKWILRWAEAAVRRVPGLRHFYDAVKQIASLLVGSGKNSFQRVVLVEFPRPGSRAIGLVTNDVEIAEKGGKRRRYAGVFVPTNHLYLGHFILVPDDELTHLEMPVSEAIKIILSVGSAAPALIDETRSVRPRR